MIKSILTLAVVFAVSFLAGAGETIFADGKLDGKLGKLVKLEGNELVWTFQPKHSPFVIHPADADFSAFNAIEVTFDASATGKGIICFGSNPAEVKEFCYFWSFQNVEKPGLQTWTVPFKACKTSRTPVGWNKIDSIMIAFHGWNLENEPGLVLKIKSIKLIKQ